jgi:hypothetical protein
MLRKCKSDPIAILDGSNMLGKRLKITVSNCSDEDDECSEYESIEDVTTTKVVMTEAN